MRLVRAALFLPVSLLAIPSATAFASLPPGTSPHDEITRAAAKAAGYPDDGRIALLEAVRAPDLREMEWDPTADTFATVGLQEEYRPEHHCDRLLPATHQASFQAGVDHIAQQRRAAAHRMATGDPSHAVRALGSALHAVQDCFSHSSAAEQGPHHLRALETAILDGGPMPEGLRLTAMSAHAKDPGAPDDPYGHDGHAKDTPHYSQVAAAPSAQGGPTHYDLAHEAATNSSVRVLEEFLAGLDDEQRRQLAAVDIGDQSDYLEAISGRTLLAIVGLVAAALGLGYAGRKWWQARRHAR